MKQSSDKVGKHVQLLNIGACSVAAAARNSGRIKCPRAQSGILLRPKGGAVQLAAPAFGDHADDSASHGTILSGVVVCDDLQFLHGIC